MRTRSMGPTASTSNVTCNRARLYGDGHEVELAPEVWSDVIVQSVIQSMVDQPTPGFKRICQQGGLVFTPCTSHKLVIKETPVTIAVRVKGISGPGAQTVVYAGNRPWSSVLTSCSAFPAVPEGADNRGELLMDVRTQVYNAVGDGVAQLNESIAELGKSFQTVNNAAKTFCDLMRILSRLILFKRAWLAMKNGQMGHDKAVLERLKKRFGDPAALWLEFRYGIMPILYDIQSLQAIAKRLGGRRYAFARGTASDSWESEGQVVHGLFAQYDAFGADWSVLRGLYWRVTRKVTYETVARGAVAWRCLSYLGQVVNLAGLDKVLSTTWNLAPLSFVADWLVGISKWLSAIEPKTDIEYAGGFESVKTVKTVRDTVSLEWGEKTESDPLDHPWTQYYVPQGTYAYGERTEVETTWERGSGCSVPLVPLAEIRMGPARWADAAALAAVLFSGKPTGKDRVLQKLRSTRR